jgi:uncharacterized oligopeptide transporter (OPT) family protein
LISDLLQSIGLIFDVLGVLFIIRFFKKSVYKESSPYGVSTNTAELLTNLANEARFGSILLVIGFAFQFLGLWIEPIILIFKGL